MAVNIKSGYTGEALQTMLVAAFTGNEIVDKGLIHVQPNISKNFYLPRIKPGKMLRKRVEQPKDSDSKGDFTIDDKVLTPEEFMAFTTFNPRAFDHIWRKWQPTGELVFAELPAEAQALMLSEMAKTVQFELGWHIINGEYAETGDDKLFNGILKRITEDVSTVKITAPVAVTQGNVIETLGKIYKAIPKAIRSRADMRILMSVEDFDKYDDALSALPAKGTAYTDTNAKRFKGITIETLCDMPENVIVATIASSGVDSNLWLGVGDVDDQTTVKIDRLENAGERYFLKMLMKADTQTAWGGQTVLYDGRSADEEEDTADSQEEGTI